MSNLLTEQDVAKYLNVSLASVRRWRLERRGPQFIKVGTLVRYRIEDLQAWVISLPTGGAQRLQPALHERKSQRA
jgi:excisionase family DNA binding protein